MPNQDPQSDTSKDTLATDRVHTSKTEVSCTGDGGALGHPTVFLHMENGQVDCPYCDRVFIFEKAAD
jgi:uncharacterized Zn-finger protein